MIWEKLESYDALSARASAILLDAIQTDPTAVLGLPTGRTPTGMYRRVIAECAAQYHCFRDITTFNLDEYVGIPPGHEGSYCSYMKRNLFDHVDIAPPHAHIPNGTAPDLDAECRRYENEILSAGGIGLTFLGLGRNGHIGFNEPGTPFDSRTRVVRLTESTRVANAAHFPDGEVPTEAITMGIGTILDSKRIVLLATGSGKEGAIERLRSREVDIAFPASALWTHGNVQVLIAEVSS
ncbi:MAG TPA: glucosamine-6-phosphate deaminase [Thermoanaerobaculia bacterium]